MIGFVNRVDVRIQENCTAETMKGHNSISKRFLFASMMKGMMEGMKSTMGGMMTGAEKMACYSTCGVCDCDDACFNRQPCKLCKDFICSKNQAHFKHQSQTTLSTAIIQSTNKQTTHSLKHTSGYQTTDKITTKITVSPTSIPADTSTTANQSPINVTLKATNNSPCQSSPCLNGGFCVDKGQTYLCYCQSSPLGSIINTGKRCEFHIDLSKTLTTTEAPWFVIPGK
ncbi:unnamed protein product [Mytilus coruscus]|uniref:EGF-like domain-containing protein n=1 Tax=Mytilus coruscus TaxID=42192 RepID=A0A6J8EUS6_MYTCO|nr:unnamed protein product [Mytilus coruscus]